MAKARRGKKQVRRQRDPGSGGGTREHWRSDGAPKTAYRSAGEANGYALQALLENGVQLEPYVCTICGQWHVGSSRT